MKTNNIRQMKNDIIKQWFLAGGDEKRFIAIEASIYTYACNWKTSQSFRELSDEEKWKWLSDFVEYCVQHFTKDEIKNLYFFMKRNADELF